jgi:hypothetical protein
MTERLAIDQMPGLLRAPALRIPLGLYLHVKSGNIYVVVGGTFLATGEDQQVYVHYVSLRDGYSAHRTPEDFLMPVADPVGGITPRFALVRSLAPNVVQRLLASLLLANLVGRGFGTAFGGILERILASTGGESCTFESTPSASSAGSSSTSGGTSTGETGAGSGSSS